MAILRAEITAALKRHQGVHPTINHQKHCAAVAAVAAIRATQRDMLLTPEVDDAIAARAGPYVNAGLVNETQFILCHVERDYNTWAGPRTLAACCSVCYHFAVLTCGVTGLEGICGAPEPKGENMPEFIHRVRAQDGALLAYIIRAEFSTDITSFITPPEHNFQVGLVVHPQGGEIQSHFHRTIDRHISNTSEVLVVRKGRCEIDVFDSEQRLVETLQMTPGDVMVMVAGGHGFRMLEDTVLLEIKQGPYIGIEEKERF